MSMDNHLRIDYTNKDYASLKTSLLELASEKLPAWSDHSPNDLGILLLELFAYMGDMLFYHQDRIANESYLDTALGRRSVINLMRLIGYELRPPQPASAELTLLFPEDATGTVVVPNKAEFKTSAEATGTPIHFRYFGMEIKINLDEIDPEPVEGYPDKHYKPYKILPVTQADTYKSKETIGSSDGSPSQRFALKLKPLMTESLVVTVDDGSGPKSWQRKDTLFHSRPNDEHFSVRRDEEDVAWIEFGNGKYGKIPARGTENIVTSYCVGGGIKGNVLANTITKAVNSIDQLKKVFNPLSASGGTDREPLREAARRAPHFFRSMERAVTAQDYEELAKKFGIAKVRARAIAWNRIDLVVAPAGGGLPTDTLKQDLLAYFEDKRIMTSIPKIRDPINIGVYVVGTLVIEPRYFADQIQQQVQDAILKLLSFDEVEFEDILYLSKVYEVIEAIEGVAGVTITHLTTAKPPNDIANKPKDLPDDGVLRFRWNEIPFAGYSDEGIRLTKVSGGLHDH